ncbi:uncharacterized protein C4orf54-like [Aplochiton taeniatus]
MEAVEETLTYHDDTGLNRTLLPYDKNKDKCNSAIKSDESTYVDLDMKTDGTKTVKVTFTGEGNQLAVFKCNSDTSGEKSPRDLDADNVDNIISKDIHEEHTKDKSADRPVSSELPIDTLSLTDIGYRKDDFELGSEIQNETDSQNVCSECEELLQYTDMYLNSKTESDEGANVVLSETDDGGPNTAEDESHYITTHEIQLTELDHDVDYDLGRGTCWDFEDDNLVYSFVDYASFESDQTTEGTLLLEGRNRTKVKGSQTQSNITHKPERGAIVSPELESDLCDWDKGASSDESICKPHNCGGNLAGKIHLSIKTSSRAINESNNILENDTNCPHTKHVGDRSHFFFTSTDTRTEALCDRSKYFIPAPGRQHLATKLRGKDINEYSSGASSSISELDDADKEVRNLTAKSFRSLACPYFDAINLSTSSESSMSEYGLGLNQWSAYVDLKYGSMSKGREQNLISHKSSSATFQMGKTADCKNRFGKSVSNRKDHQTKMHALNKKNPFTHQGSSSSENIELKDNLIPGKEEVITLTETLNFRCNVQAGLPEGARRPNCSKNAHGSRSKDEITGAVPVKLGCEVNHQHMDTGDSMEDTHKKAIFASSLLKNVISKKMQFEQERKMERGEIRDTFPAQSQCFQCRHHQDITKERGRGLHRQTSDTSSGFTLNSLEEQWAVDSRPNSSEPTEERENQAQPGASNSLISAERGIDTRREEAEPMKGPINWSLNSAFKSWKEGEQEPKTEIGCDRIIEIPTILDNKSIHLEADSAPTKMSKLFVPSSQIVAKDSNFEGNLLISTPEADPGGKLSIDKPLEKEENEKGTKAPEIKIQLRSVKENKGNPLDIANLLTPKINTTQNQKPAGDSNCQVLAVSDKIPHFTVRDIRDNKCKFQTPIYQGHK